ncbi:hypothetical protein EO92_05580 [Methanosarcina sp. 2.H.A.1B.4]|nr:hypothetical protein EO92_05580 [Methanosarcina sp. 2.H.A.1B.4]
MKCLPGSKNTSLDPGNRFSIHREISDVSASLSGGSAKKGEKRRKIIREERNTRLKSPVKIYKTSLLLYSFSFGSFLLLFTFLKDRSPASSVTKTT